MASTLPSLSLLPFYVMAGGLLGYAYGNVTQTDPIFAAKILSIAMFADTCLFTGIDYLMGDREGKKSHLIHGVTNAISMGATLKIFRDFNLIGTPGTMITSTIVALHFIGKFNIYASN